MVDGRMKIAIVSTAALPAPPSGYGGLEWIAYHSATELAKLGNEVFLLTTNDSRAIGVSEAIDPENNQVIGHLTTIACGPTSWTATGERDMFLNYAPFLAKEFGSGQGVVIDHSWWGYPYFLITGGEILLRPELPTGHPQRTFKVQSCPDFRMCHVIHGVTGWRLANGEHVPPPGVQYPRIMGVSKTHAGYLSAAFKRPVRYVFNGVKIPDSLQSNSLSSQTDSSYVLSLNRISREKGIHNSIDVCLATKTPLKVVGDDEHVSDQKYVFDIMDRCQKSGGLVEYVGSVDNNRKWDYIRNCSALITCPDPSNYVESFYMAAVEGWSQGKPILSLPNGGLSDIVIDGVNGFLAANPEDMKNILLRGKEVFIPARAIGLEDGKEVECDAQGLYEKKTIRLEDISPEGIKQEANKYTIENMAIGYLEICKGIQEKDPSFNW